MRCPKCNSARVRRDASGIRQCRRCGPLHEPTTTVAYRLVGQVGDEPPVALKERPTLAEVQPSRMAARCWTDLWIEHVQTTTHVTEIARWRDGVLVGDDTPFPPPVPREPTPPPPGRVWTWTTPRQRRNV